MPYKDPAKDKARRRIYREKNREVLRERGRIYRKKNREQLLEKGRLWRAANAEHLSAYQRNRHSTPKGRFLSLRRGAKKRGLLLEIDFAQYVKLVENGACTYCEKTLPKIGYGLDRKDSMLGYTTQNCVPCCRQCNEIRGRANVSHVEMFEVAKLLNRLRTK